MMHCDMISYVAGTLWWQVVDGHSTGVARKHYVLKDVEALRTPRMVRDGMAYHVMSCCGLVRYAMI